MKKLAALFALSAVALIACTRAEPKGSAGIDENALTSDDDDDDTVKGDDDDDVSGDDDDDTAGPASCLNTAPIDATRYRYLPSNPPRQVCTAADIKAIGSFYAAHAADADRIHFIDAWPTAVGSECASCAFTRGGGDTWAPIVLPEIVGSVVVGDIQVDQGGCIAAVSQNEDCGKAFQKFSQCRVEACETCTTGSDYSRCFYDERIRTTACKVAYDTLTTSCGPNLLQYQAACKGTSYTFDGPIRVLCGK